MIRVYLTAAVLFLSQTAWALPEDAGKFKYSKVARTATLAGKSVTFDLFIPSGSGPMPVVTLGHGFARSKAQMAGWGALLASRGFIAMAPNFPGGMAPDHKVNGKVISALLEWAVADSKKAGSPLNGLVDPSRRGVMGHSAGGLASVLAAGADTKIKVVVGLDPVDMNGLGKTAAALIKVPVTIIRAEPSTCNSAGNAAGMVGAIKGPLLALQVIKGTHCDPEWPSGILCTLACGATDAQRQARFRRYAMATLDHVLRCAAGMAPWLGGPLAKQDAAIKGLTVGLYLPKQLGCTGSSDAGVPDAAPVQLEASVPGKDQAAAKKDGPAAAQDAPTANKDGAITAPDSGTSSHDDKDGCDCSTTPSGEGGSGGLLLLLFLGSLLGRNRRRR